MEGRLNTKSRNPMIVIGRRIEMATAISQQQIESLKIALTYLLDHYHFTEFKAVGHSNGGPVLDWFIGRWWKEIDCKEARYYWCPYQFNQEM